MPSCQTTRVRLLVDCSLELLELHAEVGQERSQAALDDAVERLAQRLLQASDTLAMQESAFRPDAGAR